MINMFAHVPLFVVSVHCLNTGSKMLNINHVFTPRYVHVQKSACQYLPIHIIIIITIMLLKVMVQVLQ